jgi:hypothetical protein
LHRSVGFAVVCSPFNHCITSRFGPYVCSEHSSFNRVVCSVGRRQERFWRCLAGFVIEALPFFIVEALPALFITTDVVSYDFSLKISLLPAVVLRIHLREMHGYSDVCKSTIWRLESNDYGVERLRRNSSVK